MKKQNFTLLKELIIGLIVAALFNLALFGCYASDFVPVEKYHSAEINKVVTQQDSTIDFSGSELGRAYVDGDEIIFLGKDGTKRAIPVEQVKAAYHEYLSLPLTAIVIGGSAVALFAILLKVTLNGRSIGG